MIADFLKRTHLKILRRRLHSFNALCKALDFKPSTISEDEFQPYYQEYTTTISSPNMAASLQLASFVYSLCETVRPAKVLDLGSGFSSFVLRYYAKIDSNCQVWSVDDDEKWLEKSRQYVVKEGLSTQNMVILENFVKSGEKDFDLILLDLNFVEVRKDYINLCVERCRSKGLIIFDDVHKSEFEYEVLLQTANTPVKLFDAKPVTLDSYQRYATVSIKD